MGLNPSAALHLGRLLSARISYTAVLFVLISNFFLLKFIFFKKATKIDEIFTVDLTLTT